MLDQHLGEGLNGITEGVYRQGEISKSPKNVRTEAISIGNADHQLPIVGQDSVDLIEDLVRMLHVLEGVIHAHVVECLSGKVCVQ